MTSRDVKIVNETGFHARPAQLFVQKASQFQSAIKVKKEDGMEADAKSILGLMTLALVKGTTITIEADGVDEKEAVEELIKLIESKFGEA